MTLYVELTAAADVCITCSKHCVFPVTSNTISDALCSFICKYVLDMVKMM